MNHYFFKNDDIQRDEVKKSLVECFFFKSQGTIISVIV